MNPDLCGIPPSPGLVANLLATTDCRASILVERGYAALSSPGAATAAMLTSLMVIAVALYGYRLLLGRGLLLGEVVGLAIRLGVVLLLAASWSSFQTLAYDAIARAPSRVASDVVAAVDAPAPLDGVQTALDQIELLNAGWRTRAGIASPLVGGPPTAAMALNLSSFLLTVSTLGLLIVSRILLSILLAITPLVAGFLLFDATRGLLQGWLHAVVTAAIAPMFVLILATIELAILTPLLDHMVEQQAHGLFEVNDVTPVGLVVLVFSIAIVASARVAATIAGGIRLPRSTGASAGDERETRRLQPTVAAAGNAPLAGSMMVATPVVRALEAAARRDSPVAVPRSAAPAGATREPAFTNQGGSRSGDAASSWVSAGGLRPTAARTGLARVSRASARRDL